MAMMMKPVLLRHIYDECSCPGRVCRCGADKLPDVGDEVDDLESLQFYPRVFAVDPGTHTGWACLWFDPDVLFDGMAKSSKAAVAWQAGMVVGPEKTQVAALLKRLRGPGYGGEGLAIVVEKFTVRAIRMEETFLSPVRVGHMLDMALWLGGREVDGEYRRRDVSAWQQPADMTIANDERLRLWQTYLPGADHPRDATRHAWIWMRRLKSEGEDFYNEKHFVDMEEDE